MLYLLHYSIYCVPIMCPYICVPYMCVYLYICTKQNLYWVFCCILGIGFTTWAIFSGFILLSVHLLNKALLLLVLFYFCIYVLPLPLLCRFLQLSPPHGEITIILHLNVVKMPFIVYSPHGVETAVERQDTV